MASLVAMPVDISLGFAVAARWDIGQCLGRFDRFDELVAVVAFIGRDCGGGDVRKQGGRHISDLATGQDQTQRIAQGIDTGVNLGGQSATRPTDRLIATVFLRAPAECWWARTMLASMKSTSKLASSRSASATRAQTLPLSQRANRTYVECQFPKSSGKSRQGQPVRATKSTASTKRRLSTARPPLSVVLPGSKSAIRDHCLSLNIRRLMCNIQISGCKHKSATVNRP